MSFTLFWGTLLSSHAGFENLSLFAGVVAEVVVACFVCLFVCFLIDAFQGGFSNVGKESPFVLPLDLSQEAVHFVLSIGLLLGSNGQEKGPRYLKHP